MIECNSADGIATVTINRPERQNALAPAMMVALRDTLLAIDRDPEVRVAIITGAGDRAFCAGADIKETQPTGRGFLPGYFDREIDADHPLYIRNIAFSRLRLTKPLIAAVNGVAVGGGMEIALNCDLCIGSSHARFGLTEVRLGSIPAVGGIQRLLHSLPRPIALRMLLTGEIVAAAEALAWGLVSEIVEPEQLLPRASEIAGRIAANAPLAVKAAKLLADKAAELPLSQAIELEEVMWGHLHGSQDRIEGRRAFAEKRPPHYRGE